MTKKDQIVASAVEIINNYPNGIRYSQLSKEIYSKHPTIKLRTIQGQVVKLDTYSDDEYSGAVYTTCPVIGNHHSGLVETDVPELETA